MAYDILIVDDELDIARLVAENLEDEGYTTRCASDGQGALDAVSTRCPSLVILDIWLGDSRFDGIKVLEELRTDHKDLPVIMMSGHGTIETAVTAIKKGAYDFIEKPFKMDRMLLVVERALETVRLRRENEFLRRKHTVDSGFMESALIATAVQQIVDRVAPANSRLLIQGPPGSGKELVARLVHERSPRRDSSFTVINCGALKSEALEIELFGSEEVTGCKVGLLEASHLGTVLFDEVTDLPLDLQSKLVRFLQEGTFVRHKGERKVTIDVRVLASSTKDLALLVANGTFREDLYYRLNVVPIKILSLKDRLSDFADIVDILAKICCKTQGIPYKKFAEDAILALKTHEWPGNLSQLKNVVEWTLVMTRDDPEQIITSDMLPAEVALQAPAILNGDHASEIMALPLRDAREKFEKEYLLAQVSRFSGNISHTAHFVGMERSALHRKLKNLKIER